MMRSLPRLVRTSSRRAIPKVSPTSPYFYGGLVTAGALTVALAAAASDEANMAYGPIAAISDIRFMEAKLTEIEVDFISLMYAPSFSPTP